MRAVKKDQVEIDFKKAIQNHGMGILLDEDQHRNISFKSPEDSFVAAFNLITWPGHLCISGDYGSFVFQARTDMFGFFNQDYINPDYWSEKLVAKDVVKGHKEYSFEVLKENIESYIESHWEFTSHEQEARVRAKIEKHIYSLPEVQEIKRDAYIAVDNFTYKLSDEPNWNASVFSTTRDVSLFQFDSFYEYDSDVYTYRYLWCLNAIVWGVKKYFKFKNRAAYLKDKLSSGEPLFFSYSGPPKKVEQDIKESLLDKLTNFIAFDYEAYQRGDQDDFDFVIGFAYYENSNREIMQTDEDGNTYLTNVVTVSDCTKDKVLKALLID